MSPHCRDSQKVARIEVLCHKTVESEGGEP